jgi:hypothetical protein
MSTRKPYPIFARAPGGGYGKPRCSRCGAPWPMNAGRTHDCVARRRPATKKVETPAACRSRGRTGFSAQTLPDPPPAVNDPPLIRYVDLLIDRYLATDDPALLDRIERVLGLDR